MTIFVKIERASPTQPRCLFRFVINRGIQKGEVFPESTLNTEKFQLFVHTPPARIRSEMRERKKWRNDRNRKGRLNKGRPIHFFPISDYPPVRICIRLFESFELFTLAPPPLYYMFVYIQISSEKRSRKSHLGKYIDPSMKTDPATRMYQQVLRSPLEYKMSLASCHPYRTLE